ncbi:hypothetical protein TNCV_2683011 [Trichonephila clavipes]|nr:hypothetical protein TNCV_2683011 [Trichonephila clavipes]
MGQYDDDECTLPMCVHLDATEHGCNHLDAVKRTWIHLKKRRLVIRAPRFVEGSELANMVANDAKRVAKVAKLAAKNDTNLALPPRFRQVLIESPL